MGSTAGNFKDLWDGGGQKTEKALYSLGTLQDMLFMC